MRVVIADDAVLFREGLGRVLEAVGIRVTARVEDAEQLLGRVRADPPDAVVVDIRMPPTHTREGLDAAQRIRVEHPQVGVLVLSQYVEPITPCSSWRTAPVVAATCSRTASPTSPRWSMRCAASPAAGR